MDIKIEIPRRDLPIFIPPVQIFRLIFYFLRGQLLREFETLFELPRLIIRNLAGKFGPEV